MFGEKRFATRVGCIDGRTHEVIIGFAKKRFRIDYIDMVTHPGANRILSNYLSFFTRWRLKRKTLVSKKAHGSNILIISGHYECAGNPVTENEHKRQLKIAFDRVQKWEFETVVAVWINKNWQAEVVCQTKNPNQTQEREICKRLQHLREKPFQC